MTTSSTGVPNTDPPIDPDFRAGEPGARPSAGDGSDRRRVGDTVFRGLSVGAGALVIALVTLIGVFLLMQAIPALARNEANFLTSSEWTVAGDHPRFGIASMLWVTVSSSIIALLFPSQERGISNADLEYVLGAASAARRKCKQSRTVCGAALWLLSISERRRSSGCGWRRRR